MEVKVGVPLSQRIQWRGCRVRGWEWPKSILRAEGSGCGVLRRQADFSFLFLGWRVIKNREDSFCVPFLPAPTSFLTSSSAPALSRTHPGGRAATRSPRAQCQRAGCPALTREGCAFSAGLRVAETRLGPLGPRALGSSPLSLRGVGTAVFRFEFFCCCWRLHRSPRVRSGRCWWEARSQFLTSSGDGGRGKAWGDRLFPVPLGRRGVVRPRLRAGGRLGKEGAAGGAWRGHCNLDPRPLGHLCGPSRRWGGWGSESAWVAALHPRGRAPPPRDSRVALHARNPRVPGRTAPRVLETHRAPRAGAPRPAGRGGESPGCGAGGRKQTGRGGGRAPGPIPALPGARRPVGRLGTRLGDSGSISGRPPPTLPPWGSGAVCPGSSPSDAPTRGVPAPPAAPAPSVRPALLFPGAPRASAWAQPLRAAPSAVWEAFGREPKLGAEPQRLLLF